MAETGAVKWFNGAKGYGFLVVDDSDPKREVFFHATDLKKSGIKDEEVDEGHRFSFDIADTPRGVKATNLARL